MSESTPKFKAPKGFTRQSSDAVGFWHDDGTNDILFIPKGVKLLDGSKKTDPRKPSIMMLGELRAPAVLKNKDETIEGNIGDTVGVFWKPGMGKAIVQAYGIETWIAPLYDENGKRKVQDTGKASKMKLYDTRFAKKIGESRVPILEDSRVKSRRAKTPFDDPASIGAAARATAPEEEENDAADDVDDDDVPY